MKTNFNELNVNIWGKTLAVMLLGVLMTSTFGLQTVLAQTEKDLQVTEKVKTKVRELGVNDKKRVEVKLKNNTKFKGNINAINSDSFTLSDAKTGTTQTFAYSEVKEVKKSGISALTWGIIGGVAAAAVIVSVTVLYPVLCDGGAGC
jgi:hypothetical protein